MSIKFVVGLGNPEEKYNRTFHNLGRQLVEYLQDQKNLKWRAEKYFDWTDSNPAYVRLKSYMNCSGDAVSSLIYKFKADPSQILFCYDDFDLTLGTIRIRKSGSAGSHNGLKSVVECLQTENIPRLRLGIGPLPKNQDPANFVLSSIPNAQLELAAQMFEKASAAIEIMCSGNIESAMNCFNKID